MGKAKALVEASRDTLYRAASAAFDETSLSKTRLSSDAKVRLQLAVSFAAEACAEAVRYVNDAVGASSIRTGKPVRAALPRCPRAVAAFLQEQCAVWIGRTADVRARE